jgi:hypothetical protein
MPFSLFQLDNHLGKASLQHRMPAAGRQRLLSIQGTRNLLLAQIRGLPVADDVACLVHSRSPPAHEPSLSDDVEGGQKTNLLEGLEKVSFPTGAVKRFFRIGRAAFYSRNAGSVRTERWLFSGGLRKQAAQVPQRGENPQAL